MPTERELDKDDPKLVAWEEWKASEEGQNTLRWAGQNNAGSLWAAFVVGWHRAGHR